MSTPSDDSVRRDREWVDRRGRTIQRVELATNFATLSPGMEEHRRKGLSAIVGTHDPDPGLTVREWVAEVWADTKSALVLLAAGALAGFGLGTVVGWLAWGPW